MRDTDAVLTAPGGGSLRIPLTFEGGRWVGHLVIDGVSYHFEKMSADLVEAIYTVDTDPGYVPSADAEGNCCMIAPMSR